MGPFRADACSLEVRMTCIMSDVIRSWYAGCRVWGAGNRPEWMGDVLLAVGVKAVGNIL
jgi:hypothetical protein